MMTIYVKLAHQYGQRVVHPVCEKARLFADIAGTKNLTPATIELVKKLGYTVEVITTEPKQL